MGKGNCPSVYPLATVQHDCSGGCWLYHANLTTGQAGIILGVLQNPEPFTPGGEDYYTDSIFVLPEFLPWGCNTGVVTERTNDFHGKVKVTSSHEWTEKVSLFWDYGRILVTSYEKGAADHLWNLPGEYSSSDGPPDKDDIITVESSLPDSGGTRWPLPDVGEKVYFLNLNRLVDPDATPDSGDEYWITRISISNPIYADLTNNDVFWGIIGLEIDSIRGTDGMLVLKKGFQCAEGYFYDASPWMSPSGFFEDILGTYRLTVGKYAQLSFNDGVYTLEFTTDVPMGPTVDLYWEGAIDGRDKKRTGLITAKGDNEAHWIVTGGTGDILPTSGRMLCCSRELEQWDQIAWWEFIDGRGPLNESMGLITLVWDNPDEPRAWRHVMGSYSNLLLGEISDNTFYPTLATIRASVAAGKGIGSKAFPGVRFTDCPMVTVGFSFKKWAHHWPEKSYRKEELFLADATPVGDRIDNILLSPDSEFYLIQDFDEMLTDDTMAVFEDGPTYPCHQNYQTGTFWWQGYSVREVAAGCYSIVRDSVELNATTTHGWCNYFQYIVLAGWRYYWPGPRTSLYGHGHINSEVAPMGEYFAEWGFRVKVTRDDRSLIGKYLHFDTGIPIDPSDTSGRGPTYTDFYEIDYDTQSTIDERPAGTTTRLLSPQTNPGLPTPCDGVVFPCWSPTGPGDLGTVIYGSSESGAWKQLPPTHDYDVDKVVINGNPSNHCRRQNVNVATWREPGDNHIIIEATCNGRYGYTPRRVPDPRKFGGRFQRIGMYSGNVDAVFGFEDMTLANARGAFKAHPEMCSEPSRYCRPCKYGIPPFYLDMKINNGGSCVVKDMQLTLDSPKSPGGMANWSFVGRGYDNSVLEESIFPDSAAYKGGAALNDEASYTLGNIISASADDTWVVKMWRPIGSPFESVTEIEALLVYDATLDPINPYRPAHAGDEIDIYFGFWRVGATISHIQGNPDASIDVTIRGGILDEPLPTPPDVVRIDYTKNQRAEIVNVTQATTIDSFGHTLYVYDYTVRLTEDALNALAFPDDPLGLGDSVDIYYGRWARQAVITLEPFIYDFGDPLGYEMIIRGAYQSGPSPVEDPNGNPIEIEYTTNPDTGISTFTNPLPCTLFRRHLTATGKCGEGHADLPMMVLAVRHNYVLTAYADRPIGSELAGWRKYYGNAKQICTNFNETLEFVSGVTEYQGTTVTLSVPAAQRTTNPTGHEPTNIPRPHGRMKSICEGCPNCDEMPASIDVLGFTAYQQTLPTGWNSDGTASWSPIDPCTYWGEYYRGTGGEWVRAGKTIEDDGTPICVSNSVPPHTEFVQVKMILRGGALNVGDGTLPYSNLPCGAAGFKVHTTYTYEGDPPDWIAHEVYDCVGCNPNTTSEDCPGGELQHWQSRVDNRIYKYDPLFNGYVHNEKCPYGYYDA